MPDTPETTARYSGTSTTPDLAPLTSFGLGMSIRCEPRQGSGLLTDIDLKALVHRHGLLLIRGASLDDMGLEEVARVFGSPNIALPAAFRSPSSRYVRIQSNVPGIGDQAAGGYWHTDGAWSDPPTAITLLFCDEAPRSGGGTLFVDMRSVHDALPPTLQHHIAGLRCNYPCREVYAEDLEAQGLTDPAKLAELQTLQHPLVRVHPTEHRRALYLHERLLRSVVGLDADSGHALLHRLWAEATNGRHQYHHRWAMHDLLIWDNYSVMHKALPADPGERKITRRVTV